MLSVEGVIEAVDVLQRQSHLQSCWMGAGRYEPLKPAVDSWEV